MYKTIIPATDWYFSHPRANEQEPPVVWNLAAWGLKEDGEVIGLVGAFGPQQAGEGKTPHLVSIPPVAGAYLHRSQLTDVELEQAKKR
ncbi:hypothetical protein KDX27_31365 [Burkholderia cenocepacia]|uniref:hypothetical protein n=1 Tax=Burkholderia cenocepacia TaxID=95486 RepID=UPI001BA34EE8|nr:hypothetical protein [Burkholderia cenocepacia]MBR8028540.1 hypothetical protein [Burkholderia cenocepacia]MBR8172238.1 hypothetical protein [Burkholderia cenocepacia]